MNSRPCVRVTRYTEASGGEYPNNYTPYATVDLTVYIPPFSENTLTAIALLDDAYDEARRKLWKLSERIK